MTRSKNWLYEHAAHWQFWMVIAYFAIAWTIAWLALVYSRTLRDEAIREAEARSAREAAVARCLESRPQTARVSQFVQGVNEGFTILVLNSAAVLNQTPRSDPQYRIRKANLRRLIAAREKVLAIKAFPVPSVAECRQRGGDG